MQRFALGRDDARTVDAQPLRRGNQAEFHRVPVQPGEILQRVRANSVRLDATAPIGLHEVGKQRIHQQRHVPEQIMEQVRFGDVVDLVRAADPPGHREAPVGQMIEEIQLRQQPFHTDQRPAGGRLQHRVERVEARNLGVVHAHCVLRLQELIAGPPDQQRALPPVQRAPGGMVVGAVTIPRLLHHRGGVDRHIALVGELVLDAARRCVHAVWFPKRMASP